MTYLERVAELARKARLPDDILTDFISLLEAVDHEAGDDDWQAQDNLLDVLYRDDAYIKALIRMAESVEVTA